jgi:chromosome partitioning protein
MRIIAIGNQKGGVGKSTLTHNLGSILAAEHNQRILLVDIDPQSSLTSLCGVNTDQDGIVEVLQGKASVLDVATEIRPNLDLVSSDVFLAEVETELVRALRREDKLKVALAAVSDHYDICLIDSPPSLSLMTVNALSAANDVVIPTLPQIIDVRGLLMFLDTIDQIRTEINPQLKIYGILLNLFDGRLIHHRSVKMELENVGRVLPVQIGRSIRIAEAGIAGEPLREYDPSNKQLANYRALAEVILQ